MSGKLISERFEAQLVETVRKVQNLPQVAPGAPNQRTPQGTQIWLGKAVQEIGKGNTGQVRIVSGPTKGTESSQVNLYETVFSRFVDVGAGQYVILARLGGSGLEILNAVPSPSGVGSTGLCNLTPISYVNDVSALGTGFPASFEIKLGNLTFTLHHVSGATWATTAPVVIGNCGGSPLDVHSADCEVTFASISSPLGTSNNRLVAAVHFETAVNDCSAAGCPHPSVDLWYEADFAHPHQPTWLRRVDPIGSLQLQTLFPPTLCLLPKPSFDVTRSVSWGFGSASCGGGLPPLDLSACSLPSKVFVEVFDYQYRVPCTVGPGGGILYWVSEIFPELIGVHELTHDGCGTYSLLSGSLTGPEYGSVVVLNGQDCNGTPLEAKINKFYFSLTYRPLDGIVSWGGFGPITVDQCSGVCPSCTVLKFALNCGTNYNSNTVESFTALSCPAFSSLAGQRLCFSGANVWIPNQA